MGAGGPASEQGRGAKRQNKGPQSRRQKGPGSGGGGDPGAGSKDPLKAVSTKTAVGFTKSTKRQQDEDLTELEVSPCMLVQSGDDLTSEGFS